MLWRGSIVAPDFYRRQTDINKLIQATVLITLKTERRTLYCGTPFFFEGHLNRSV